jgi:ribosomal protein S12 methylthiotransferase
MEMVLDHINKLTKMGTKHIDLMGDNLTEYGIDRYGRPRLHEIIQIISQNPSIEYISAYELTIQDMYPELLQELVTNKKMRFVSIQIQMASDNLLRLMGRQHTVEECAKVLFTLRKNPYLKVATCLMTGFPEETFDDVKQTTQFLQRNRVELEKVNLYQNSPYIPSNRFIQLSEEERQRHYQSLLKFQKNHNYNLYKSYEPEIKQAMVLSKDDNTVFFDLGLSKWGISSDFGYDLPNGAIVPVKQAILTKDDDNGYVYKLVA